MEENMLDFKKILWPNNFSDVSLQALPWIKSLITKYNAEAHLIYVAEDLANYGHYWGEPNPAHIHGLHEFALKGAQKKLEAFCQKELVECPLYEIHVVLGDPVQEILNAINEFGVDLVVMSIHGMRGYFYGESITQKVIQYAPVPVLTINPGASK